MRKFAAIVVTLGLAAVACLAGLFVAWRRNPRLGTRFMNERLNPILVGRGVAGAGASEIGTIEHIGRTSGTRRLSPVHPEPTADGFRIIVPLGPKSQWARNVLAAGHCRMHYRDAVYELDEPRLVDPLEVDAIPLPLRRAFAALGFSYLQVHTFSTHPGAIEATESGEAALEAAPEPVAAATQ